MEQSNTHIYVTNSVKKYPKHLKILEYRKGYYKRLPEFSPADEWISETQYHQQLINSAFTSVDIPEEYQQPSFQQVPMPHHSLYKLFLQAQDRRMGIQSQNELEALLTRSELLRKSMKRSKQQIFDLIACNDFDMFVTFSFGKDHYDIEKSKRKMMNWIKEQQKTHMKKYNKKFQYVLVPEFHKDRKAIHFHGLLNNYRGRIQKSKNPKTNKTVVQKGKIVYNILSYQHGFTNLTYIKNKEATARYVTKYVTKDVIDLAGQKRYWFSKGLKKPQRLYNVNLNGVVKTEVYKTENFTISNSHDILEQSSD